MYKAKILANLGFHGFKWVNYFCATRDILGEEGVSDAIDELVREGKIERRTDVLGKDKWGRDITGKMYRLIPPSIYDEDTVGHLTVIK